MLLFALERVWLTSLSKRIMPWGTILLAAPCLLIFVGCLHALGSEWEIREKRKQQRKLVIGSRGLALSWHRRIFVAWKKINLLKLSSVANHPGAALLEITYLWNKRTRCWRMILPTAGDKDEFCSAVASFETSSMAPPPVQVDADPISIVPQPVHSVGNLWPPMISFYLSFNGLLMFVAGMIVLCTLLFIHREVQPVAVDIRVSKRQQSIVISTQQLKPHVQPSGFIFFHGHFQLR